MMKRLKIIFAILITSSTLFAAVDMNSREMKNLGDLRIAEQLFQIWRVGMACGNLHHVRRAVAVRELHHAQPVAMRIETQRLGVDRHRLGVARKIRQVAAMQADGHGRSKLSLSGHGRIGGPKLPPKSTGDEGQTVQLAPKTPRIIQIG